MKVNLKQFSSANGGGKDIFHYVEASEYLEDDRGGVFDARFIYEPIPGREHGIRKIHLERVSEKEDRSLPILVITRAGGATWVGSSFDDNPLAIKGNSGCITLLPPRTKVWLGRHKASNKTLGGWKGNLDPESFSFFHVQVPPRTRLLRMRFRKDEAAWEANARLNEQIAEFANAKGVRIDQVVIVDEWSEEVMTFAMNAGYGMEIFNSSHPLPEPHEGDCRMAGSSMVAENELPAGLSWVLGREHWHHPSHGWKSKTVLIMKRGTNLKVEERTATAV